MTDEVKLYTREELERMEPCYERDHGRPVVPVPIADYERLLATARAGLADRERLTKELAEARSTKVETVKEYEQWLADAAKHDVATLSNWSLAELADTLEATRPYTAVACHAALNVAAAKLRDASRGVHPAGPETTDKRGTGYFDGASVASTPLETPPTLDGVRDGLRRQVEMFGAEEIISDSRVWCDMIGADAPLYARALILTLAEIAEQFRERSERPQVVQSGVHTPAPTACSCSNLCVPDEAHDCWRDRILADVRKYVTHSLDCIERTDGNACYCGKNELLARVASALGRANGSPTPAQQEEVLHSTCVECGFPDGTHEPFCQAR